MNWATVGSATATPALGTAPTQTKATDPLTTRETFIKLLVAQLQHQNPLSPADGTEFLSQLTQISSFEQSLEIRQNLDSMKSTLEDILEVQKSIQEKAASTSTSTVKTSSEEQK